MGWIDGLPSAIGGIASTLVSGLYNSNQASKDRAFQERMYYQQLEDNRENWRMQNEYDLPSAQIQRLRDANLNPYLMYGNGASGLTSNGSIGNAQSPKGAQAHAIQVENIGAAFNQGMVMEAQTRNINADTELKTAQALTEAENTIVARETGKQRGAEATLAVESLKDKLRGIKLDNLKKDAEIALSKELAASEPVKRAKMFAEMEAIDEQKKLIRKQIDDLQNQMDNRTKITDAQIKKFQAEVNVMVDKAAHEMALMDAEARKLKADAYLLELQSIIEKMPEVAAARALKVIGEGKKALYSGTEQEIKSVMSEYIWNTMPKYDPASQEYRDWLQNYVTPVTESLGSLLGGSGAAALNLLK